MTLLSPGANIAAGGQILAADELTVYSWANGSIDSTNITSGSLSGTVMGNVTIGFGKLKSNTSTVGVQQGGGLHFTGAYITLPSATTLFPGLSTDSGAGTIGSFGGSTTVDSATDFDVANKPGIARVAANIVPQYIIWLAVLNHTNTATNQAYFTGIYLQASPPYDLGDGEIPLFVFGAVGTDGIPRITYVGQDPPWTAKDQPKLKLPVTIADAVANPTDISVPAQQAADGTTTPAQSKMDVLLATLDSHANSSAGLKIMRDRWLREPNAAQKATLAQSIASLQSAVWNMPPATQAYKNRNMTAIPHPFIHNDLTNGGLYGSTAPLTPVMLDPMDPNTQRLAVLHESGENVNALLHQGYIKLGNTQVANRNGPPNVMVVSHAFKNTKG